MEEAKAAGVKPGPKETAATPVCDKIKAACQWNTGWDGFFEIDPAWTEAIIAASLPVYTSRHVQAALKLGATMEEIMEVLKICVSQGMQASNLRLPILAEELERIAKEA